MRPEFTASQNSISLSGLPIPGAEDRQQRIAGFDHAKFSSSSVVCIGAGGIISQIAPTLVRKGIGRIVLVDQDIVEVSNLNRQRFYIKDVGENKAIALARNLQPECIAATEIVGHPFRLEEAIARGTDLSADVAICGVDNNQARVAASRYFRSRGIPVIFAAVSRDGDCGYVFAQARRAACLGCLYPDLADDDRFPCPGTPAIADILQATGSFAVYAVDTFLMTRRRSWNYRRISLYNGSRDASSWICRSRNCRVCGSAESK